ncbi:CAMK family protein kinase [Tritrichomonas foetus]|uniref:CAMK family protein kinase n=1 Tax=Tritrichomonas foetus TaxID=1144522 RepID=A0A1J4J7L1_9EUKA|nr:CAMK family protein kinase [Tritrichomonas foetus]|eukprot:OHS95214.1 CAMK family protein kinase [Tritrichomonas foetus]
MISIATESEYILNVPQDFSTYHIVSVLGRGSFSVVFKVVNITNKKEYACKVMLKNADHGNLYDDDQANFKLFAKVARHPNLIYFEDVIYENDLKFIIMELCENGELYHFIRNNPNVKPRTIQMIFFHIVSAISYLHSRDIAHRDIKPENVLLNKNMCGKICDYGFSLNTKTIEYSQTPCGSTYYSAPEVISGRRYDPKKADIWSIGVLLFYMRFGGIPWRLDSYEDVPNQILSGNFFIPSCERSLSTVIHACMRIDPCMRPTAQELLMCEYLQSIDETHNSPLLSPRSIPRSTQKIIPKLVPRNIIPKKVARSPNVQMVRFAAQKRYLRQPFS